ncbi:MAG: AraC family transcriptional regulator [Lachnospiraceae bacterium]|nr:AraC family transcriptional regulator [Lachnospiraceae bacterium]
MKKNIRSDFQTRQYMLSKDYELYYYSDLHFKNVNLHSHDYYEFYFFLNGRVEMLIEGKSCPLAEGDIIAVPPGVLHQARILDPEEAYSRIVLWISRESFKTLKLLAPSCAYIIEYVRESGNYVFHFDPVVFNDLRSVLLLIFDEQNARRFGREDFIRNYITELLLKLSRQASLLARPDRGREEKNLFCLVSDYIDVHLSEDLSLESLAGNFYVSPYHLSHLFKEKSGLSLHQYITKKRLAAAKNAILAGEPASSACRDAGFWDYSGFYRAFSKEYGVSPKKYRLLIRKEPDTR